MTNQIFYWKQITSPADLPKEEGEYDFKVGKGTLTLRVIKGGVFDDFGGEWETRKLIAYACPLTVDNIPEWVEEKAREHSTHIVKGPTPWEQKNPVKKESFLAGASLLLPILAERERELATMKKDMEDAAGELMVKIPESGTEAAKMLSANTLMRWQNQDLKSELEEVRKENQGLTRSHDIACKDIRMLKETVSAKIKKEKYWRERCEAAENIIKDNPVFANDPQWSKWENLKSQRG